MDQFVRHLDPYFITLIYPITNHEDSSQNRYSNLINSIVSSKPLVRHCGMDEYPHKT